MSVNKKDVENNWPKIDTNDIPWTEDQQELRKINHATHAALDMSDTTPKKPAQSTMVVERGVYSLNSVQEQMTYAKFLIDNKLVSDTFKNPSQLIVAIQFCKDLGLPNSSLSNFYVVGGRPAIYGDVLIGLVMGSGQVQDKIIQWFDEEGETITRPKKGKKCFGCEVSYKRAGFTSYTIATYTFDDKDDSRTTNPTWIKFWKDMLWRRADVRAIKALFPDTLKGIEVVEYLEDANTKLDDKEKAQQATQVFSEES